MDTDSTSSFVETTRPPLRAKLKNLTPSQTIGPFFAYSLTSAKDGRRLLVSNRVDSVSGTQIRVKGQVFDGDGEPVPDAMLEIWQADPEGRLAGANDGANIKFTGFARAATDQEGSFIFETVKPGRFHTSNNILQAPHISVIVFARGILTHLHTRIYFADETSNDNDPILAAIEDPNRRATLISVPESDGKSYTNYHFDIRLQGEGETVFFQWS